MSRLAYFAALSVLLALIAWTMLALANLSKVDSVDMCGHRPVYRRCVWDAK